MRTHAADQQRLLTGGAGIGMGGLHAPGQMHRAAAQGVVGRFHPLVEFPPQLLLRLRQLGSTAEVVLLVGVEVVVVEHLLAARLLRPAVLQQILLAGVSSVLGSTSSCRWSKRRM